VESVLPESLAVGVSPDAPLVITFSERIDPQSLEKALWVTPGGAAKPRISGSTEVEIRFAHPLPESSTVGVLLTTALRDRPLAGTQNPMKEPYRWFFSTGDSLWPGRVYGTVKRSEGNTRGTSGQTSGGNGQLLVALYRAEGDTVPEFGALAPEAITEASSAGSFDLSGLPADGRRLWLVAMLDRNSNREIFGAGEYYSARPETLRLTEASPELEIALRLVNPNEPGTVRGHLRVAAGDTTAIWIQLFGAGPDTTNKVLYRAQVTSAGDYTVGKVAPGIYRVVAVCDRDGSGDVGEAEPSGSLGVVTVPPGETVELVEQEGPCPGP